MEHHFKFFTCSSSISNVFKVGLFKVSEKFFLAPGTTLENKWEKGKVPYSPGVALYAKQRYLETAQANVEQRTVNGQMELHYQPVK